jgi:protein-S-isoprenylcysteine O-methyltransferase Ste14
MTEITVFNYLLITWFLLAAVVFAALFFVAAPYGRHIRRGWGPTLTNRTGWLLMEAPAPLVFALLYFLGEHRASLTAIAFLLLWEAHYVHRAFIYPFSLANRERKMPLTVVLFGFIFNLGNAYLNGRYLFTFVSYPNDWLGDFRFLSGAMVFIAGFVINRSADEILHHLRKQNNAGYRIPFGGMYRWISCPNYFGEILTWTGWAIATWSLPGLAFAVWTFANLAPRARTHHRWYLEQFPDYPKERKALIPGLW